MCMLVAIAEVDTAEFPYDDDRLDVTSPLSLPVHTKTSCPSTSTTKSHFIQLQSKSTNSPSLLSYLQHISNQPFRQSSSSSDHPSAAHIYHDVCHHEGDLD